MTVGDLDFGTVKLLAEKVKRCKNHINLMFLQANNALNSGDNDEQEKKQKRLLRLRTGRFRFDHVHDNRLDID